MEALLNPSTSLIYKANLCKSLSAPSICKVRSWSGCHVPFFSTLKTRSILLAAIFVVSLTGASVEGKLASSMLML